MTAQAVMNEAGNALIKRNRIFPSSPPLPSSISQLVVVTFDSLQPSRASSPKMTATKDYSALPLQKYA